VPTELRAGPYRFFFYAGDRDEPQHVHVERNDKMQSFGWIRSGCKGVVDFLGGRLVGFRNC